MTKKKSRTKRTASAVKANPVTTTSLIGIVVAAIGKQYGWDAQTQAYVVTAFLAAGPVVRGLVAWWESKHKS